MKNLILLSTVLLSMNLTAETYRLTVTSTHVDKDSITIRNTEGDVIPTCTLPEILNEAKNACINPIPTCTFPDVLNNAQDGCINTFDKVGWIDRTDSCQGVRAMSTNANVLVLRANTNIRNNSPQIPEGYRWLTYQEYDSLVAEISIYNYYSHCGHSGYPTKNGQYQREISFSNSFTTNYRTHSGTNEGRVRNGWDYPTGWFGIAVVRDN